MLQYMDISLRSPSSLLVPVTIALVLMIGCAARQPAIQTDYMDYEDEQLQQTVLSLDEIVQRINERENHIHTLKSTQKITFQDRLNRKTRKVKGFIAFERPENYRIQLTSIMGITVMDIVDTATELWIDIPHLKKTIDENSQDWDSVKNYFPFEEFPSFFIHQLDTEDAILKIVKNHYLVSYFSMENNDKLPVMDVWVQTGTLLITRIDLYKDKFITVSFRYDDYQKVQDSMDSIYYLPFYSEIHLPMNKVSIYLESNNYQINADFPASMFERRQREP